MRAEANQIEALTPVTEEGLAIIKGARDRYDGVRRPPIPRNPWNEIECGGHYARAMSSWSILLAISGYEYDGPARILRFAPRITPNNFKDFFCSPEAWGSLRQTPDGRGQDNMVSVVDGQLAVAQLRLAVKEPPRTVKVARGEAVVEAKLQIEADHVLVTLATPLVLKAGEILAVSLA